MNIPDCRRSNCQFSETTIKLVYKVIFRIKINIVADNCGQLTLPKFKLKIVSIYKKSFVILIYFDRLL